MQIYDKKILIICFCLNSSDPSAPEIQSISSDFDLPVTTITGLWIVSNYLGLLNPHKIKRCYYNGRCHAPGTKNSVMPTHFLLIIIVISCLDCMFTM